MLHFITQQNYALLKLSAVLGCGLVAGVFFAFSTFVMSALARLPAQQGIAAMQAINITAINLLFMGLLFGTAGVCLLTVVLSFLQPQPGSGYLILGGLIYLIGTILVTIFANVPLNDQLALMSSDSLDGVKFWNTYQIRWSIWNHVRTVTSLVAAILLAIPNWFICVRSGL